MTRVELTLPRSISANTTIMMTGQDKMRGDITPAKIIRVPLSQIDVGERQRKHSEADVQRLYDDIYQHGLLQPIGVKMHGVGRYKLIYGLHRFLAFKQGLANATTGPTMADWNTIPAIVYELEMPKFAAELKEIAENLIRKNLTKAEEEEHLGRYVALLKRNRLVVEGKVKPPGKAKEDKSQGETQLTVEAAITRNLSISKPTLHRTFEHLSQRARTLAKAEGLPEPARVTPTSPAEDIEATVELSARHTEARKGAEVPRKVMPLQPQLPTVITVRVDVTDPQPLVEWFKDRLSETNKPVTKDYIRKLATGLLALIEE
jgi:hypothetical protein